MRSRKPAGLRCCGSWPQKSLHASNTCFSLPCLALCLIQRGSARHDPSHNRSFSTTGAGEKSRRDGFARDCPHRHPVLSVISLYGIAWVWSRLFRWIPDAGQRSREGLPEERRVRGGAAHRVQVIVSRARFRGPGWEHVGVTERGARPQNPPPSNAQNLSETPFEGDFMDQKSCTTILWSDPVNRCVRESRISGWIPASPGISRFKPA